MAEATALPEADAGDLLREQWSIEQFLLGLGLVDRFLLDVLIVPTPRVARAVLALLREELPARRGELLEVRRFAPDPAKASALDPVESSELVADVLGPLSRRAAPTEGAMTLTWVDASDARAIDDDAWTEFFYRLNERRNAVIEAQPGPLVLVLPYRLERTLAHAAPDVWSVRSGVYRVHVVDLETHVFDVAAERPETVSAAATDQSAPRSFALSMALMGEEPARFDDRARSWVFAESVSQLLREGRLDEAATVSREALERARRAVAAAPDSKGALEALERALDTAEDVEQLFGEDARARALVRERLDVIDRLAGDSMPAAMLLRRRAAARSVAASYGLGQGLPLALAGLADAREHIALQGTSQDALRTLAQCLLRTAQLQASAGENSAAMISLDEALSALGRSEGSLERGSLAGDWLVSTTRCDRAEVLSRLGRHDAALMDARAALEIAKRIQQNAPLALSGTRRVVDAWRQLARTYQRRGDAARTAEGLSEFRTVVASAFRRWPQSALTAYWRVSALHDSAAFALEHGRADEARAWISEALELGNPLLERVPDDEDVRTVVVALRAMQEALPSSS
jgi:tetratricopeptide (TPR) repeat protein